MEKIQLNHWYVANNRLSITFRYYFVSIEILEKNCFLVEVHDSLGGVISFPFSTLEKAISFVENSVSLGESFIDINQSYLEGFSKVKKNRK